MHHATPNARARAALVLVLALLALATSAPGAHAGGYWWTGSPAVGANGFSWSSGDAAYWNPWSGSGRCETRGTTVPAGNPCTLTWHAPANLDAQAGSISGSYRQAHANFEQRMFVDGNGTTVLQGTATAQSFTRSWPDMSAYLSISLLTPSAATTVSAGSQHFQADSFSIYLVDPHVPALNILTGHEGWHGTGGACIRYGYADAGSGIQGLHLLRRDTGVAIEEPSYANAAIVSGVFQTDRTACVPAPGTGTYPYQVAAVDRSGNYVEHPFAVAFDTTAPSIGAPQVAGAELTDGRRLLGSAGEYRPTITFATSDPHSGVASTQLVLDGVVVSTTASFTPDRNLAPGEHTVTLRATDAMGNAALLSRRFVVVDDVAPSLAIASPAASGDGAPVLDVTAVDDLAGVEPSSWTVRVNGAVLVASSDTARLQAEVGELVDGDHAIEVLVTDRAGNVATRELAYDADSGDDLPDPPGLDGLYVMASPDRVEEGATHHVRAIAVRDGRPLTGRVELRAGALVLGADGISRSGAVDVLATIPVAGPLLLHPPDDSGLDPVAITYEFVAAPPATGGGSGGGAGPGSGGTGGTSGGSGSGATTNTTNVILPGPGVGASGGGASAGGPGSADAPSGGYPRNVVYYVGSVPFWNGIPLAESGAKLDTVPPTWKLGVIRERPGAVRRLRRIAFRLWTNEMSVLTLTPQGATRRTTVNPRRTWRTVHVLVGARTPLGRRFAAARAGTWHVVRITVVATDKNENRTRPRTLTFRVRG